MYSKIIARNVTFLYLYTGGCIGNFDEIDNGKDPKDYEIQVTVRSDGSGLGADWKVDLIKFYFMGNRSKEEIIYCYPGNGNGEWIERGQYTFL